MRLNLCVTLLNQGLIYHNLAEVYGEVHGSSSGGAGAAQPSPHPAVASPLSTAIDAAKAAEALPESDKINNLC
jgi:hypothetical protein